MSIVVLSQASPKNEETFSERNLRLFTESARLFGNPVHHLPSDWDECSPEEALVYVPEYPAAKGLFIGYINQQEYYDRLYAAAKAKGVNLVNSPEERARAMEFDRFY